MKTKKKPENAIFYGNYKDMIIILSIRKRGDIIELYSEYLLKENEKQALEKYINGDYILGKLDKYGQRISIKCSILRKDTGETATYTTDWMVCPNGKIRLITPYGGK